MRLPPRQHVVEQRLVAARARRARDSASSASLSVGRRSSTFFHARAARIGVAELAVDDAGVALPRLDASGPGVTFGSVRSIAIAASGQRSSFSYSRASAS